jgi:hypothetical protein
MRHLSLVNDGNKLGRENVKVFMGGERLERAFEDLEVLGICECLKGPKMINYDQPRARREFIGFGKRTSCIISCDSASAMTMTLKSVSRSPSALTNFPEPPSALKDCAHSN